MRRFYVARRFLAIDSPAPVKLADKGPLPPRSAYRREVLQLYRDIRRATRFFTWKHPSGLTWREVLEKSARDEFETAKREKDPMIIGQLLVAGQEALAEAQDRLAKQHELFYASVQGLNQQGGVPPTPPRPLPSSIVRKLEQSKDIKNHSDTVVNLDNDTVTKTIVAPSSSSSSMSRRERRAQERSIKS